MKSNFEKKLKELLYFFWNQGNCISKKEFNLYRFKIKEGVLKAKKKDTQELEKQFLVRLKRRDEEWKKELVAEKFKSLSEFYKKKKDIIEEINKIRKNNNLLNDGMFDLGLKQAEKIIEEKL